MMDNDLLQKPFTTSSGNAPGEYGVDKRIDMGEYITSLDEKDEESEQKGPTAQDTHSKFILVYAQ